MVSCPTVGELVRLSLGMDDGIYVLGNVVLLVARMEGYVVVRVEAVKVRAQLVRHGRVVKYMCMVKY